MSEIDFTQYTNIDQIVEDIKTIKIQGATNVAIATFEAIKMFLKSYSGDTTYDNLLAEIEKVGKSLAYARPNEPLAQNGLKYIITMLKIKSPEIKLPQEVATKLFELCDEYLELVKSAKRNIIEKNAGVLGYAKGLLTHCHSSTSESLIIDHAKKNPGTQVVCTETRPLFQGRITAADLLAGGVDTTLVADNGADSFILGNGTFPVDAILIGCDEITMQGDALNKIGSWGIALAAYYASKPIYVVGSILKTDVSTVYEKIKIEMRESREIWPEAPLGLKIVNPAFDYINGKFITGYLTEVGLVKPEDIDDVIRNSYEWLF